MSQNKNEISFEDFLKGMSPSAFEMFGVNQLSYIKPTGNDESFELHSANGHVLAKFKTFDGAIDACKAQDLKAVTVH